MKSAVGQQVRTNAALAAQGASSNKAMCLSIDWPNGLVTVRLPGGVDAEPVQMPMVGVPPVVGWRCVVGFFGQSQVCLGPESRPSLGTVASLPSSGVLTVTCADGGTYPVTLDEAATVAVGDRVQLDWGIGGTVIAKPAADPLSGQTLQPGGPSVPGGGTQTKIFYPIGSGTWQDGFYGSGWLDGDLFDGDHRRGAYFYQGIADTIPDSAHGTLRAWMPSGAGSGGNPSLGGHDLGAPVGTLNVTAPRAFPSSGGWVDLSDLFDAFKTGSLLGVGTGGGGNWRFAGSGGQNGALQATY